MAKNYNRENSLGMLSGKVHSLLKKELQRQLDERNIPLKVEFYPVINRLLEEDRVSQQTIADWVGYDRARTSRMIDELEKKGMVERIDDPESRRTKLICLTTFAQQRRTQILDAVQHSMNAAFKGLGNKERNTLIEQLQLIKSNLERN